MSVRHFGLDADGITRQLWPFTPADIKDTSGFEGVSCVLHVTNTGAVAVNLGDSTTNASTQYGLQLAAGARVTLEMRRDDVLHARSTTGAVCTLRVLATGL